MAFIEAIVGPVSKLLDKIIPDPQARDKAKLELLKLQGDQEMANITAQMQAIVAEAKGRSRRAPRTPVVPAPFDKLRTNGLLNLQRAGAAMRPDRLCAFTDGVVAIIITIMVLELPVPHEPGLAALRPSLVLFAAYALSFVKVGIY